MRSKYLLTTFILVFSLSLFYSCSDDSTNNDTTAIPDDAVEFSSPEQAADFATQTLDGIGEFVGGGLEYLGKTAGDTTYYKDGWWINEGDFNYGDDTTSWKWNYTSKYRFKKNGKVQKEHADADEMDLIMDIVASFSGSQGGYSYDYNLKYYFDLNYTNLQSQAPVVNGSGYYDYKINQTGPNGTQKLRYYIKYNFEDLAVPYDGYPTGKLTVETKKYKVVMVFNGTNIVKVTVYEGNSLVWGPKDYNLDSGGGDYLGVPKVRF